MVVLPGTPEQLSHTMSPKVFENRVGANTPVDNTAAKVGPPLLFWNEGELSEYC